jgi:two-component system response regulator CpxR
MGGIDLLRELRTQSDIPVLMLTAKGEEVDRIVGLEMGADDYLPKPFNPRELLARIRAVVRRIPEKEKRATSDASPVMVGDVVLDPGSRSVRRSGQIVEMTAAEFDLLEVLLDSAGSVVTRDDLTRQGLGRRLSPYDRSIDVHISSLRKKLGPMENDVERIRTIRGIGYQYALPGHEIFSSDNEDQ